MDRHRENRLHYRVIVLSLALLLLTACSDSNQSGTPAIPEFSQQNLVAGRNVWINTCRNCHLMGVAGAPAITDNQAWTERRQKGIDSLYSSAVQGIRQNNSWSMPPRGGNDALVDEQVRDAVDYMLAAVDELSSGETSK